jgi:hypothetical protein
MFRYSVFLPSSDRVQELIDYLIEEVEDCDAASTLPCYVDVECSHDISMQLELFLAKDEGERLEWSLTYSPSGPPSVSSS